VTTHDKIAVVFDGNITGCVRTVTCNGARRQAVVSPSYHDKAPFAFNGQIEKVVFDLK
jgi:hypothetical protein